MIEQELIPAKIIVFRVDSSEKIGSGHVMRCLTLAEKLKKHGTTAFFICSSLSGNSIFLIKERGYKVHVIDSYDEGNAFDIIADAEKTIEILRSFLPLVDWLIIDHYFVDEKWELLIRPYSKKIMVIDDLANRYHDCDLLLDQNLYVNMDVRYKKLTPDYCKVLLGPGYALLRPEFIEARTKLKRRDGRIKHILVFFGGSDSSNETAKTLKAIQSLQCSDISIDVVIGMANLHKNIVQGICNVMSNTKLYCQVNNMAELMIEADFAIGAGGTTTWERCFLGLPSITIVVADNQLIVTAAVAAKGATWNIGQSKDVSVESLANYIEKACNHPEDLKNMTKNAFGLMK